jgi:excisionase family DNA binding protein
MTMTNEKTMPQQLTATQVGAARMLGVSDRTIRRWESEGRIKAKQVGGVKLYPVKKLRELAGVDDDEKGAS